MDRIVDHQGDSYEIQVAIPTDAGFLGRESPELQAPSGWTRMTTNVFSTT
ncbi:hypothetical protein EES37_27060 [Streptomyces sp. ADI91-18]|nr:hypothetical protein EES37_27060 [Streptomyces sp. ADI91-18]